MEGDSLTKKDLEHIRALLEQHIILAQDTNKIIHDMRKWGRVAFAVKVVAWTVVLILPLILLPFLSPLLNLLPGGIGGSTSASSTSLFGFPSPTELQQLIHPAKSVP